MAKLSSVVGITACALGVTSAAAALGVRSLLDKVARNPDPVPRERLMSRPAAEELSLTRPDGTVLQVRYAGSGKPVVFAHGYTGAWWNWNLVWDKLIENGYRVIAFDQRGHGDSTIGADGIGSGQMAEDYAAIFTHFDLRDAILVGHSMGGFVAIRAVLDQPEVRDRLRGLVLFSTWAGRVYQGAPQTRIQVPLAEAGIMQRIARTAAGGRLLAITMCGSTPSPAVVDVSRTGLNDHMNRHGPLVPILRAFNAEDRYPRLGEIRVPTVVMVGDVDRTTPRSHAHRMADGIPGARLVVVPEAGHLLNVEGAGPDTLVEVIASLS